MNITSPLIDKLLKVQTKYNFTNNELLLTLLTLNTNKLTTIKKILNHLKLENQNEIFNILSELGLISKNEQLLISKLKNTKITKVENFEAEITEIIEHLNLLTNSRLKVIDNRKKIILSWLRKGISVKQFKYVNEYFYFKWANNPKMSKYIVPETLYNKKFESRLNEAENIFESLELNKVKISNILNHFHYSYNKNIKSKLLTNKVFTFNHFLLIDFWLKEKYSEEDLIFTISKTIEQWSKKQELIPFITIDKILDSKFPERFRISKITKTEEPLEALKEWIDD